MSQVLYPTPFILASLLTSYPDEGFVENVSILLEDESINLPDPLNSSVQEILRSAERLADLKSEYIEIFDHSKVQNPLYETEYGRERAMFKANELSDIAGFYRAFGFEMDENGTHELQDHVSVELEFYSLLMMKVNFLNEAGDQEGAEIVTDAMRKFLESHLGRFVSSIGERPGVQSSPFYSSLIKWCADVVASESERLGVNPEKATWFASQAETEEVACGATVAMGTCNK